MEFVYIIWNQSPEIIDLGFLKLHWYGLFFAMAFLLGQKVMTEMYKWEGRDEKEVDNLAIYIIAGTVLGARLGHCLFYDPVYYLSSPLEILKIWEGGLASHGGAAGVLFALWLYSKKHNTSYVWLLDRTALITLLAGTCIRMGNLMNSEIIGKPTDVSWAFIFQKVDHLPRHPAQLYEAISCFMMFIGLFSYYYKYKASLPEGRLFGIFMTLLFTLRFFYEFLKEEQVDFERGMSLNMGQLLSIPLVLIGVLMIVRSYKRKI
jgi:phosphatidylglycerol:prolipoprotein diacylglycerol transferase